MHLDPSSLQNIHTNHFSTNMGGANLQMEGTERGKAEYRQGHNMHHPVRAADRALIFVFLFLSLLSCSMYVQPLRNVKFQLFYLE